MPKGRGVEGGNQHASCLSQQDGVDDGAETCSEMVSSETSENISFKKD